MIAAGSSQGDQTTKILLIRLVVKNTVLSSTKI